MFSIVFYHACGVFWRYVTVACLQSYCQKGCGVSAIQHACTCSFTLLSLHFSGLPTHVPPLHSLFFIHPVGSPLFFYFSGTGARVGAGLGLFWQARLMAGLQMGQAFRCSSYLALGSAVPALHVPVHPTSTWDERINS